MTSISVLIADDHPVLRAGMKALLQAEPDLKVVGEAGDGRRAVQLTRELRPDVVIMDISMPELNGIQATHQIRRLSPETRVVALTVHEDRSYIKQLLEAGAAGYVIKRSAAEDLARAIRVVGLGGTYLDPHVADQIVHGFVGQSAGARPPAVELTEREEAVLRLSASGLTNREIADRFILSVKTVETFKRRAMEKLGLLSRAELVRHAIHEGWFGSSQ